MAFQKIPVNSDHNQSFDCSVAVDGNNITLKFNFRYNEIAGYWIMKVSNSDSILLIDSIPILSTGNILSQYAYLGIGSAYIVKASNTDNDYPNDTDLGNTFALLWGDTP